MEPSSSLDAQSLNGTPVGTDSSENVTNFASSSGDFLCHESSYNSQDNTYPVSGDSKGNNVISSILTDDSGNPGLGSSFTTPMPTDNQDNSNTYEKMHPTDTSMNFSKESKSEENISFKSSELPPAEKSDNPNSTSASKSPDDSVSPKDDTEDEWLDILGSGHLLKKILKHGEPEMRPNKSDICTISFTGRREDGTVVEEVENIQIHLNDNEVIQGIDFALALMEKGEQSELKVGPRFAYGALGKKPEIPSGATLLYTVTLHDIKEDPPIHTVSVNDRITLGLRKKERGNWWYSREEHSIAINCYRRALEFLDDTDIPEPHSEEDVHRLIEERLKTYNNLTASQMKIHAYDAALMSVNHVLTAQPQNVKALFRKAKILREKGDVPEAIKTVRLALTWDKDSLALQQELASLLATQRKDNTKQRELYKKMMGSSSSRQEEEKEHKKAKNPYIKWTSILAFAAVVVAGTVALKYKM